MERKEGYEYASGASEKFRKPPFWQVGQKFRSSLIPIEKKNTCLHQGFFRYCHILDLSL